MQTLKAVDTRPKVIVAIPTKNRPANILRATLHSVAEQTKRYGHDVEIVVSDLSDKTQANVNAKMIETLRKRFTKVPIHHYSAGKTPISKMISKATSSAREAYFKLIPTNGRWGANRNRLALLSAYHGGNNALYLHLDDDTPLFNADSGYVRKKQNDAIRGFIEALAKVKQHNGASQGFAGSIVGVPIGHTSKPVPFKNRSLKEYLFQPSFFDGSYGCPGRILEFGAITEPYSPTGFGEVITHNLITGVEKLPIDFTNSPAATYSGFGFTIPDGSTITSLKLLIHGNSAASSGNNLLVKIKKNGETAYSQSKEYKLPSTVQDVVLVLPGTYTPQNLREGFTVKLEGIPIGRATTSPQIDQLRVEATYRAAGSGTNVGSVPAGPASESSLNVFEKLFDRILKFIFGV